MRTALRPVIFVSFLLAISACASPGRTVSTFDGPAYKGPAFSKLLVIGMADSYNNRVTFERTLTKEITAGGSSATALYTLIEMNSPIDRPTIEKVVEEGGYDGVLITRAVNRDVDAKVKTGTASTKMVRKDGSPANLFRYDYEELNEPVTLTMEMKIVIASELFSVESRERVWSIEADIANQASVDVLVTDASRVIASRLRKDGLIRK